VITCLTFDHPEDSWGYLDPKVELLPTVALKSGYRTALLGKWHFGLDSPNTPTERGFEDFQVFGGDMMDDYDHHRRPDLNSMRNGQMATADAGISD
jgi:arylsulfatase A-like enzyme